MTIILRETNDKVTLAIPAEHPLMDRVREEVPGATWDGTARLWYFPATRRVAKALREFLRGATGGIDIDASTKTLMGSLADSEPGVDITLLDEQTIAIKVEFHKKYQDLARVLDAKLANDGTWLVPVSRVNDLLDTIQLRHLDLIVDSAVQELAGNKKTPPPHYDGSFFSLTQDPVSCLEWVAEAEKRNRLKTPILKRLESTGLETLFDVVNRFPLRYIDRSSPTRIADLVEGEPAVIVGKITNVSQYDSVRKMFKITIEDDHGQRISMTIFRQAWLIKKYHVGDEVIVYGKYEVWQSNTGRKFPQISSPRIDPVDSRQGSMSVVPIYPASDKASITTWDVMSLSEEMFGRLNPHLSEILPASVISKYAFQPRHEAMRSIHFPANMEEMKTARKRLVYEEMFQLQAHIQRVKQDYELLPGISHEIKQGGLRDQYLSGLPYKPTGAQTRAIDSIIEDMSSSVPMHRLLQGDVGAGKSTVAVATLLAGVDAMHQGAMMAPTEILAEQLFKSVLSEVTRHTMISPRTGKLLDVRYLGSKTTAKNKKIILEALASGEIDILIGTHSLISKGVEFFDLSTVVIDEQHRFGTEQRSRLRAARSDNKLPDMLVMTATPIPRTGAMVIYGDLNLTILDELPPGRVPIETEWVQLEGTHLVEQHTSRVWDDVLEQVAAGHQAYVVASLVEDNETLAAQSTQDAFDALSNGILRDIRVGMVHGKMARKEREETMRLFSKGEIDVLVSTTVIEVGVNVPNATIMIVLDAGRFGIAQLHQIRGRVGRASFPSRCYLVSDTKTDEGRARLQALVDSTDGFYLAERDLEIRGEGALFGQRQSGASDLRIASLKDVDVLEHARADVAELLAIDPNLDNYPALKAEIDLFFGDKGIDA